MYAVQSSAKLRARVVVESVKVAWTLRVVIAAIVVCAVGGQFETASAQDAEPAYELPEVIVDTQKKAPASKPVKKAPVAGDADNGDVPAADPVASATPEPVSSEAAGFSQGTGPGDGGAGSGPAVSSAGFTSGRIVEQVGTVDEVTAEQIERVGARTLDEAIRLMPGVYVRNGGDGVPRIDIRGMRTRNIILLVDGVPLNGTYDGQFDPRAIPVENIARIKVTRGGSSVLYGPGGNAAVIDIITKGAAPGLNATADTSVGFGQNKDARVTASYGTDAVKTFLSASIYQQDDFNLSDDFSFTTLQPNGSRVNSDREDRAFYGNTQIKVNEDIQWGFSINYREGEYGKPPSTVNAYNNRNECTTEALYGECSFFASGVRFERVDDYRNLSLQTSGLIDLGSGFTLRPLAYYNGNDELTNRYDSPSYDSQTLENSSFSEDASTAIFGGGGQLAYRPDANNLITVALDAHRESWQSQGFTRSIRVYTQSSAVNQCNNQCQARLLQQCPPPATLGGGGSQQFFDGGTIASRTCGGQNFDFATDEDLDVFSAAAEYEVKLTNQLSAVVGGGWAEQRREQSSDGDYTYLAGLRFAVTEDLALRGNVARKIRFPTLRNLYGTQEGNENLETEVTQNYEIGLDQRLPFINGLFSVTVFRIDAENFIRKPNTDTCDGVAFAYDPFCNEDKLRFQGVEANLAFSPFAGFNGQVGYSYLDASNEAPPLVNVAPANQPADFVRGTSTIDNEPEHKFMAAASYLVGNGTTLLADYQYVTGSYAVARNQIDTLELADYHLLNLGITQDLPGNAFQLYGRVENVLDENYESSFGFPEAGRVFYLGLRAKLGPG